MNIFSKTTFVFNKKKRFDPHQIWAVFCASFVIVTILLLGYFSWYFLNMTQVLDAPATVNLQTNASKIKSMEKVLNDVETAVGGRIGAPVQN